MFFKPKVSVTYNVRLKRARAQFKVGDCLKSRRPPSEALEKAREKLDQELEDGHIEYFEVFEKKFHALWQHIRDHAENLPQNKEIRFTLAQGARAYSELLVQPSTDPQHLALISCLFSERKAKTIFFTAFVFHIVRQLQNMGRAEKPDGAQLRFMYLVMKAGQKIEHWPLKAAPHAEAYPQQKILVEQDPDHHYIALHIFDARLLQDPAKVERIYEKAIEPLQRPDLIWLKDHTLEKLRSLTNKVQALGFGLPYSLLVAHDARHQVDAGVMHEEKQKTSEADAPDLPRWKVRVGAWVRRQKSDFIEVEVDASSMTATVKKIHSKALASVRDSISSDWLLHECHKQGIVFGYEKFLDSMTEVLISGKNPIGLRIAEGQAPKPGRKAYLHECYRDRPALKEGESIRDRQNTRLAQKDLLIAEVRYEDGIPGRNVFGEDVHALGRPGEARMSAGPGVVVRDVGRFFADKEGLIEIQGQTLQILDAYVHKGSVNLSSGNLNFDGAVIVQGDIEAGATVAVKGSLLVEGVIGNALVKVHGDLEVLGGVITSRQGLLAVGGSLRAQFVENSRLHVHGHIEVQKSILNSEVVCGGRLVVKDAIRGVISGGQISAWEAIAVRHMGLAQGQTTVCRIGTHYSSEVRWQRITQRGRLIQEHREMLARQLRDGANETLQLRLAKTDRVLEHIHRRREKLEKEMSWNPNATLAVRGILDRNVELFAVSKKLKTGQSMQSVLITAAPYRGSQINDLNIWSEFQKAWPDARLGDAS